MLSDVPSDILREILIRLRLPAESLFRLRTVCKAWNSIITDPSFIRSHTSLHSNHPSLLVRDFNNCRFYSLSLDSLNFADGLQTIDATPVEQLDHPCMLSSEQSSDSVQMASCNGLILIYNHHRQDLNWVIWNPSTQELHEVPNFHSTIPTTLCLYECGGLYSSGFGYDYAADDYKVVKIAEVQRRDHMKIDTHRFLVYSMKSGCWRVSKDCPYDFLFHAKGVFLNGALHWRSPHRMITVVNLSTEDYRLLPGPPLPISTTSWHISEELDVVGGCLFLSCYDGKEKRFDGWVMNDYGVEKSWMKLFSMEELTEYVFSWRSLKPVVYSKSRRQILLQDKKGNRPGVFWFDVENNSVKKVTIQGLSWISSYPVCPASLTRLDDSSSVVAKTTAGVKKKRKRVDTRLTFNVRNIAVQSCSDNACFKSNWGRWFLHDEERVEA